MASPQNVLPDPHQLFPIPSYINVMSNSNSVLCRLVITLRSPKYLRKLVTSTADVLGRAKLRSACHGDPRRASFIVHAVGIDFKTIVNTVTFKCKLKTFLFTQAYDLDFVLFNFHYFHFLSCTL